MYSKSIACFLLTILVGALTLGASAQSGHYELVPLGTLGGQVSKAHNLNASGQVTGYSLDENEAVRAFFWSESGGMINLGTLGGTESEGWGINDAGIVVGQSHLPNGRIHAFIWNGSVMQDLNPFGTWSGAWAINNDNDVVGWSNSFLGSTAFILPGDAGVIVGPHESEAYDISNSGGGLGPFAGGFWPHPVNGTAMPAIYDMRDDTVLSAPFYGRARGVNHQGTLVGTVGTTPFVAYPVDNYVTHVFVSPLPGFSTGAFQKVNDDDVVVGSNSGGDTPPVGVIYFGENGLTDVNSLLDATGEGWNVYILRDINNSGWVVGAANLLDGPDHAVLLRPIDADVDGLDYYEETVLYTTDPSLADSDSDGLEDGEEIALGTDPLLADSDGDGRNDSVEVTAGTDPLSPESITVISPNGGEIILRGSQQVITWSSLGDLGANVRIVARRGTSTAVIVASTPNDGSHPWLVPTTYPLGNNFIIEISSVAIPAVLDTSDANFTVQAAAPPAGSITVLAPNGGETLQRGSTTPITWSSTGDIGSAVKILVRRGTSGATIVASTPNDGHFDWTIPTYPVGTNYSIEISSVTAPAIIDTSNGTFSLTDALPPAGTITVIAPNGGEIYLLGATVPVTWNSVGTVGANVEILAHSAGQTFTVAASTANDGAFDWTIPAEQVIGTDYTIQVRSLSSPTIGDSSNAGFSIIPVAPEASITVLAPNGGESFARGSQVTITWNTTGNAGANVRIVARKGSSTGVIANSTPNDGSFSWTIPTTHPHGSGFTLEVSSTSTASIFDTTDGFFTITP